jgi:protoporphyrinogen oxidase
MRVGIIGGGMMGLATAFYLNQKGVSTTILEKAGEVGGLSRSQEIMPGIRWDRFYHVILSSDLELLNFIDQIGLALDVQFNETKTGFYTNGQLYSMSNTLEFLRFKPLSLIDKVRLGAGILYASKMKDWKRLEKIYVKTWLIRVFGRRNYEKMWEPLLRSKLGSAKDEASAALIWAIIKRYYGTRHSSSKTELMGCVKGGYFTILKFVSEHLLKNGTEVL